MTVKGTRFDERKLAGRALMQEILTLVQLQHENEVRDRLDRRLRRHVRGRALSAERAIAT